MPHDPAEVRFLFELRESKRSFQAAIDNIHRTKDLRERESKITRLANEIAAFKVQLFNFTKDVRSRDYRTEHEATEYETTLRELQNL